jgi:poly(3-hydroxybutyrate) depolymerase
MAYLEKRNEPVVVFAELQCQEVMEASDVAGEVKRIRREYGMDPKRLLVVGDPAGVAASQFSAVSPIGAYAALGIIISPMKAGKNPQARADLLTAFLNDSRRQPDGSYWPGIMFGPNCPALIDSIINLRWKPQTSRVGEDPREQFLKKDDHGFDSCTYGLCVVPPPDLSVQSIMRPPAGVNGRMSDLLR